MQIFLFLMPHFQLYSSYRTRKLFHIEPNIRTRFVYFFLTTSIVQNNWLRGQTHDKKTYIITY